MNDENQGAGAGGASGNAGGAPKSGGRRRGGRGRGGRGGNRPAPQNRTPGEVSAVAVKPAVKPPPPVREISPPPMPSSLVSPDAPVPTARHKNLLFQKVAIFIDAENIETSGMKHHEGRTDYKKIIELVGDREIIRILYYKPIYKEISDEFQNFWGSMGGEIRRPSKNADTFLVIDAVTMADKIDVAIIMGGDKDFLPLVWYLRSRGCRVEIWSWPETTSPEMQSASDYYQPLTEEFVISLKSRRGGSK